MVNMSVGKETYRVNNLQHVQVLYAEPKDLEWTFISAIIDSHPGKRFITWEHVDAYHAFLTHWVMGWTGISAPTRTVIRSKTLLQQWLRKNDPSKVPSTFAVCSTNTCEIRVGGQAI
jgi:hypothetical protein